MRSNYHNNPNQSQDSITKISRSKSRNQMVVGYKFKEKASMAQRQEYGWNDRFHLQHIPQYNYHNQPHSQYLKNKLRIPNKRNDRDDLSRKKRVHQPSLDKNKVGNKPNYRKNQERQKQAINKAFTDLRELWYEKSIPDCHMEIMTKIFNRQNYPMKILEDIKHEFSEVSKQTSLVQKVMSSIESRETCLEKISEIVSQWEKEELPVTKLNRLFEERINHLRILTVHCIECIYQWKQSIEPLLPRNARLKYINSGKNYLLKVIEDYNTIISSKLNQVYGFESKKHDVFFLAYTFQGKKMSVVSKSIIKRIRLCQMLLVEDQNQPEGEESKRTPMIQKIKSPAPRHDKSLPPKGASAAIVAWKKLEIQYGQFAEYFASSINKSAFKQSFLAVVEMLKFQEMTVFQNAENGEEIVLAVDKNASQRKIIIHSIRSTIQSVQHTLKSLCQYLWEHDNCTEIRTSLVHFQNGESLSVDQQLEKKLKTVGFRWASVNHTKDCRLTIYQIKRPLNTIAHKTARRKQAYPVVVEHLTVMSWAENHEKKIQTKCQAAKVALLDLLKQNRKEDFQQLCKKEQFSHTFNSMKKIEQFLSEQSKKMGISEGYDTKFQYSGLKAFEIDSQETGHKIFRNLEISMKHLPNHYPNHISLVNSSFKFRHPTIVHEKFLKFLPSKQCQILIVESNYPIYLLQSDQEMINFFIIEVEENFNMESIDSIFHAMGEQSTFLDDFWIPIFHKNHQYVDESGIRNTELASTDYWSCLGSMKRKGNKKRTKAIKPPFVFGMIHKRLLQILQIPFYCTMVRREDMV